MRLKLTLVLMASMIALSACSSSDTLEIINVANKVEQPLPAKIQSRMKALGMAPTSPIMMRIFKEEGVLEVWKANAQNRYQLIADYKICAWSGRLGPKRKEGDRQAPEGFYDITPAQMNPRSQYYLSFDMGFPNRYDRAHGSTGANLMVHGACSSAGCYSMTDAQVLQIYAFARDAFRGGQESFQVQAFPFRMTAENMARHRFSPNYDFWTMIKVGYDHFELTHRPPVVAICDKKYVFNQVAPENEKFNPAGACPPTQTPQSLMIAYSSYAKSYERAFEAASRKWDPGDFVEPSEAERKAMAKQGRKNNSVLAPRKAETKYVVVDPKAKVTPTSDAITSLATEQAERIGSLPRTDRQVIAADRSATAVATTAAIAAQTLPATVDDTKVPVPEANPLKPAAAPADEAAAEKKPFWKVW
jgi:murein L,D-transpeptidase YafK